MLFQIRSQTNTDQQQENDPVAMLVACHERIRTHLQIAARLLNSGSPLPAEISEAASRLSRYFGRALPLHIQDEDELLVPALSGVRLSPDETRTLLTMQEEHRLIEPVVEQALSYWQELASDPHTLSQSREALSLLTLRLSSLLPPHLLAEEQSLFPLLRAYLPIDAQVELALAMRARRS